MAGIKNSETCSACHECFACYRHGKRLKVCDGCYRKSIIDRLAARKIRRTLHDGCLILYYSDGWRCGYLVQLGESTASVQPLGGQCGAVPEVMRVPLTDIKPEIITSAKVPPTVGEYYEMSKKKVRRGADRSVPKTEYPPLTSAILAVLEPAIVKRTSPVNLDSEPEGAVDTSFDVQKMNTGKHVESGHLARIRSSKHQAEAAVHANHQRWHGARNKAKQGCFLCETESI